MPFEVKGVNVDLPELQVSRVPIVTVIFGIKSSSLVQIMQMPKLETTMWLALWRRRGNQRTLPEKSAASRLGSWAAQSWWR